MKVSDERKIKVWVAILVAFPLVLLFSPTESCGALFSLNVLVMIKFIIANATSSDSNKKLENVAVYAFAFSGTIFYAWLRYL